MAPSPSPFLKERVLSPSGHTPPDPRDEADRAFEGRATPDGEAADQFGPNRQKTGATGSGAEPWVDSSAEHQWPAPPAFAYRDAPLADEPPVLLEAPTPYSFSPARPQRRWLHAVLFLATLATTTYIGFEHYAGFLSDYGARRVVVRSIAAVVSGFWYSGTILAILGAHEMGHYLACRYYRIDASWPYFIPAPITMIGTFGAFIKIRQPILNKRQLFDVGIAGPLAGFVVAVPALLVGLALSRVTRLPADFQGLELGEPLLFQAAATMLWGTIPDGYSLNLHPVALAAWFGLLATLLNLFPMGQLDGGHIAYAALGRRSRHVTLAMVVVAIGLTLVSMSWIVWTVLMVVMLWAFGLNHPPTIDEDVPLDARRRRLALVALAIFVLCFTPAPIQPLDLLQR